MRKIWDIHGGIHPPEKKSLSIAQQLQQAPLPDYIYLPLTMHIGAPALPIVSVGEKVLRGQPVAEPSSSFSAYIHASISGTVTEIGSLPVSHPSGLTGMAIRIDSDGLDTPAPTNSVPDYLAAAPRDLLDHIRKAGVVGLGGAGFPTDIKLKPVNPIDTLIINGAECEPYITADHELMRSYAVDVIAGIQLLAHILNQPKRVLVGIEDNKPDAIEALRSAANGTGIEIIEIPTKYPSGGEKQIIQILTGLEVPSGGLPANLGIVVHNPGTALAALRAVREGEPLISRITTFTGEGLTQRGNLHVRIGTPVGALLRHLGADPEQLPRIIFGGPMMGFQMPTPESPILKITNCVLIPAAVPDNRAPVPQPCIRCGACAEACPAQLLPQQLLWFSQARDQEKLNLHNLFDCIECGACAYVCPSSIPLVQYYRASKGEMRDAERERIAADRARIRFETRKQRLEQEAIEREAKRLARAQAAKERQSADGDQDLVAKAMARVAAANKPDASSDARLQIQLQAIDDRIAALAQKRDEAEGEAEKDRLEAEIKTIQAKRERLVLKRQSDSPNEAATDKSS